jgi:hypothetical protein
MLEPDVVCRQPSPAPAIGSTIDRPAAAIATAGEHASAAPRDDFTAPASLLILGVTAICVIRRCRAPIIGGG